MSNERSQSKGRGSARSATVKDRVKPLLECQRQLTVVWLVACVAPLLMLVVMTYFGQVFVDRLEVQPKDLSGYAWQWFLPTVVPTAGLMIATLVNGEIGRSAGRRTEVYRSAFLFWLALGLSVGYLGFVLVTLVATGWRDDAQAKVEFLRSSQTLLAPLQGLVAGALGAFFLSADKPKPEDGRPGAP